MSDTDNSPEERQAIRALDWQDILPWVLLFRSLRPAMTFRVLFLAAVGLVGTIAGWRIFWKLFVPPTTVEAAIEEAGDPVLRRIAAGMPASEAWPAWPWEQQYTTFAGNGITAYTNGVPVIEPLVERGSQLSLPVQLLFARDLTWVGFAFVLLCILWALLIWSYFGGLISRTASLYFTQNEFAQGKRVSKFVRARWTSYFAAPLYPLLGIVLAAVPVALLGLCLRADLGALVAGVLWPLALLCGLFMTMLLVGLLFGWPLMWTTISTEGTDAFDALGRAYAYVFQRPLQYLFYAVIALGVGILGWVFVDAFATGVLYCTTWAASWGAGNARTAYVTAQGLDSTTGAVGSALIRGWHNGVRLLVAGFAISYFWSAMTAIYLLLRRHIDAAEIDEVALDEQDELYGLPSLETEGGDSTIDESAAAVDEK